MKLGPASRRSRIGIAVLLLGATASCLSGPDEVKFVRFFRPENDAPAEAPAASQRVPLVVRRIAAAGHLREPIAWVKDRIEIGHYEELRWSETPQRFVERALDEALFVRRGIVEGSGGDSIDVEVTAFEQVFDEVIHARVALRVVLEGRQGRLRREFAHDEPIADDSPESLARAMGRAMSACVEETAEWIATTTMSGADAP